jgi:hypothetical protein
MLNATPSRQGAARIRLRSNIADRLQVIDNDKTAIENQHLQSNLPGQMWKDKERAAVANHCTGATLGATFLCWIYIYRLELAICGYYSVELSSTNWPCSRPLYRA